MVWGVLESAVTRMFFVKLVDIQSLARLQW
jgi:hypothetical protein